MLNGASKKMLSFLLMIAINGLNAGSLENRDARKDQNEKANYAGLVPASSQIVDVAQHLSEVQTDGLQILTIDADSRVGVTEFRRTPGGRLEKVGYIVLGQALWKSGELSLRERIPANEVPIFETRLTDHGTGAKFYAVVTVLLSKTPHNRHLGRVYLFTEKNHQISLALRKEYGDSPKVILDDINDDGVPELAVEFVEDTGKADDLDVWDLSSTDKLRKIELPDDGEYVTEARTYFRHIEGHYHGPGNYAVVATASILRNAIPVEREIRSEWNERTKNYVITRVTDITETSEKLPVR